MRVGVLVVMISLAASLPASVLADPDSSPAAQPAANAQAAPAANEQAAPAMNAQAAPAQSAASQQSTGGTAQPTERVVVQGTVPTSNVNLDEIVCRESPPPTGSRLGGGRECHTVRQWNEREREQQRMLQQQQSTGFVGSGH
ncbi:MAG TPA: hypothetical protein VMF67_09070 [Rhizomicrobium sp.]|nr:hypothetical protein [Rhizomicrobium sp.]